MIIYSIKDNDVGSFNKPFYQKTEVEAIRAVAVGIKGTMLESYPASYTLYELGSMDENTGKLKQNDDQPKTIMPITQIIQNRPIHQDEKQPEVML